MSRLALTGLGLAAFSLPLCGIGRWHIAACVAKLYEWLARCFGVKGVIACSRGSFEDHGIEVSGVTHCCKKCVRLFLESFGSLTVGRHLYLSCNPVKEFGAALTGRCSCRMSGPVALRFNVPAQVAEHRWPCSPGWVSRRVGAPPRAAQPAYGSAARPACVA